MAKKAKDDQLKIDLFGKEPTAVLDKTTSSHAKVKLDLRDYQIEGVVRFQIWWDSPELEALIALTMGMGKTITAAACANHFFEKINPSGKILWLTHRDELVDQSRDELELYTGKACEIEQADQHFSGLSQIIVASVASLRGKRLQKLAEQFTPDLIICDEAHHALAMSWMHIKQTFAKAKVLNLTATPFRSDIGNRLDLGTILLEKNTTEGIKMGVLVPPKPVGKLEINMGMVKKRLGDYDLNSLSEMMCHEDIMKACVDLICQNAKGHKSLLFAATVEHGNLVSAELRKAGFKVGEIYGYTDKALRKEMPAKLDRGELDIIVNNLCLDEQTEIMTKDGWRGYKTIQKDDLVANWEHGHVWFSKPKKIIIRDRGLNERMVVNSTQGVRVTEGHRMLVKEHGVYRHRQSQTLVGKTYEFPVSGKSKVGRGCTLSNSNCQLAGRILGEGHGADTLVSLLSQLPGENRNTLPWRKVAGKLDRLPAFLALLHSFTDRQFSAFLSGFWTSCHPLPSVQPPGRIVLVSSDYQTLSQLQAVACCRGYSAEISNTGHNWRLSLVKSRTYKFTETQTLQIEATPPAPPAEKVWCVSTQSGNIITRRNGCITIMGNCLTEGFNLPSIDMVIMMRPTKNAALYLQCLSEDTEILTPDGFKSINDIQSITQSAGYNPVTKEIKWLPVQGRVLRENDTEEMVEYQGPQLDFRVTAGHRMLYRRRKSGYVIERADEMIQYREITIPLAGFQKAKGVKLTNAEIEFLGWFLTDGTHNKTNNAITITQAEHQPQRKDLETCLSNCNFKVGKYVNKANTNFKRTSPQHCYYISKGKPRGSNKHQRGWEKLEPFICKDMNPAYEDFTRAQLIVLLRAIHLGDGDKFRTVTWKHHSYHISSSNPVFAERLQSLCIRRGFKCNIATGLTEQGTVRYKLHIRDKQEHHLSNFDKRPYPSLAPRKKGERVWCLQNEWGTLVARRNGKVFITGNCVGRGLRKDPHNPLKTHCYIIDIVDTAKRKGGVSCPLPTDDDVRMYSAMVGRESSHPEVFLNWFYKANELEQLVAGTRSVSDLSRLDDASKVYKLLAPPWMASIQNNPASDILKVVWTPDASYKDLLKPHRINDTDAFCLMMSRKGWAYLPHGKLPTTEEQLAETEAASVPDSDTNYTLATLISQDAQLRNFILDLFDPNQSLQEQAKKCYDRFELGSKDVAWFKLINRSDVSFHFIQWKEDDTNIILARTTDGKIYWFQQIGRNKLLHVPGRDLYFSQLPDFAKGTNWANQPMSDKQSTHVAKILGVTVQEAVTARISKLSASALMSNSWNKAHIKNIATQLGNIAMLKPVVFKDDSLPKIDMDATLETEMPGIPVEVNTPPVHDAAEPVTPPSASEGVISGDEPF